MRARLFLFLPALSGALRGQEVSLRGRLVEQDSVTPLPFVYVIAKRSGNGTMSDDRGRFNLTADQSDTLLCSYIGYFRLKLPVSRITRDASGDVLLVMQNLPVELAPVVVSSFRFKPYEREYMEKVIQQTRMPTISALNSPITALYMKYSKEGRQLNKLARIFEELLVKEQVEKKMNPEILRKLTHDEKLDYEVFRKYCYYVDDQYIIEHDGAELYEKVMDCYRRYKSEMSPGHKRR